MLGKAIDHPGVDDHRRAIGMEVAGDLINRTVMIDHQQIGFEASAWSDLMTTLAPSSSSICWRSMDTRLVACKSRTVLPFNFMRVLSQDGRIGLPTRAQTNTPKSGPAGALFVEKAH